jgi:oligopeptidase B
VRRPDPYHWMRDLSSPALLSHLDAERSWYVSATGHLGSLVEKLRSEMTNRVPATDSSVSWRHHGFSYYTVLPAGREYAQLLREINTPDQSATSESAGKGDPDNRISGGPQVLLDVNDLVDDSGYVELGLTRVSPDNGLLAWSVDRTGDEVYELRFRDLTTGADLDDVITRSYYGGAWSADSTYFFYTVHDEAYRPFQVWRHRIGTPAAEDAMVLEEPDEQFEVNVRATRSGGLVVLFAENRDTSEVWVLDAHEPLGVPWSVGGRRRGVEYHAEHVLLPDDGEALLLVTNDQAPEFRLARCPVPRDGHQDHTAWSELRPEDPAERLDEVDAFADHVVLSYRTDGEQRLRILATDGLEGEGLVLTPRHAPGSLALGTNVEFRTAVVVVEEESHVEPPTWSEVRLDDGTRREIKKHDAPGHDPERYVAETRRFPSVDGTSVPATLVRHVDTPLDGTAPCVMWGYGAYESNDDPWWDPALPSLLDRGVVFVVSYPRGGGYGGRRWWLDGHLEHKQHTFSDHIAIADGLDASGLVDGSRIATRGLSAGGLLQGAVFSQRPERWRAVVAEVPFVDVVTTMLDPDVPLTANEWDEWGDPRRHADFEWMLSYSPYDNLPPAGQRPDLLVTGALHDPRVMVFEPAKWVAALRESDPQWSPRCLFRAETGAGAHAGPSGRFAHLAYEAEIYAWLLEKLEVSTSSTSGG